jgi:hypothetical protein
VAEQILTVFQAHSSRPQAPAKRVSKVEHPDTLEAHRTFSLQCLRVPRCRSSASCPPSFVVYPAHPVSLSMAILVRGHVRPMLTANFLDHLSARLYVRPIHHSPAGEGDPGVGKIRPATIP